MNELTKNINVFSFKRLSHHIFKKYGGLAGEYASKISKKEADDKARELLEMVDLTDCNYKYPAQLSGGQRAD